MVREQRDTESLVTAKEQLNNSADFASEMAGRMPGELRSSHQAVAHAADCLDAVGADLGAQVADVDADHV